MNSQRQQMDALTTTFLGMAASVDYMLADALQAFLQRDAELARSVMEKDDAIDATENILDEMCLRLLALEQPVAADLRYVVAVMRLTGEIERIADEVCNVAEEALELSALPFHDAHPVMQTFADHTALMFRNAVAAFRNHDMELAKKTRAMDQVADELHMRAVQTCFSEMSGQAQSAQRAVFRIFISRALERICDLSTNICELTIFAYEGKVIKHSRPDTVA